MGIGTIDIGGLSVSRVILGGNPFSGFSHQGPAADDAMRRYYTTERIKAELRRAESLGINAHIGRADHHVMRVLLEHWDQGGTIRRIAQTCPELGPPIRGVRNGQSGGASACFIHGGQMDNLVAAGDYEPIHEGIRAARAAGLPVGVAGHNTGVFDWAEDNLDVDFYMCCYYNPADRTRDPQHRPEATEKYAAADRDAMAQRIATLPGPVIHYKVLAAGRNEPSEAFAYVARCLRDQDAVCLGVCSKDHPEMLDEDVSLLCDAVERVGKRL